MDLRELNSWFETTERTVTLVQNKWVQLCGVDGGRWSIMFSIPQGQTTTPISMLGLGTDSGIQLVAQVPQFLLTARDMPGGVAGNWYAFISAVTGKVQVWTTRDIRVPEPEEK